MGVGRGRVVWVIVGLLLATSLIGERAVAQSSYVPISGEGSSSARAFIDAVSADAMANGLPVGYSPTGSSAGRSAWLDGTADFAVSELPFQANPQDGSLPESPTLGRYGYVPIAAGGTAFAYNLTINGQRVTNLRLSGENVARIFTGDIGTWDDPAIQADNPDLPLPPTPVRPIVRGDGSGSTYAFTSWMAARHPVIYDCAGCVPTQYFPSVLVQSQATGESGMTAALGTSFADGAIGYVSYSAALLGSLPVVKMLNPAGFYVEPTPDSAAVALSGATVIDNPADLANHLTPDLSGVYANPDPRSYPLSGYSYLIIRTGSGDAGVDRSVAAFARSVVCEGQQRAAALGHAPLPANLAQAGLDQIARIPGVTAPEVDIATCANPTFAPDGTNLLAQNAAFPQACDAPGPDQCPDGTGGLSNVPTSIAGSPAVGVLEQEIDVQRPDGLLLFTQRCGVHDRVPELDAGEVSGFYDGRAEVPASIDQTGSAPTDRTTGTSDVAFGEYPYPIDESTGRPNPTYVTVCGIDLGRAELIVAADDPYRGAFFAADGVIHQVTVVDTRDADQGWSLTGAMSDFVDGVGNTFAGDYLGWRPFVSFDASTDPVGGYDQVVASGNPVAPASAAGLGAGVTLARAVAGEGLGISEHDARLLLLIPVSADSGSYGGTLTFTLV